MQAYAPSFPQPKEEAWYFLLADPAAVSLLINIFTFFLRVCVSMVAGGCFLLAHPVAARPADLDLSCIMRMCVFARVCCFMLPAGRPRGGEAR